MCIIVPTLNIFLLLFVNALVYLIKRLFSSQRNDPYRDVDNEALLYWVRQWGDMKLNNPHPTAPLNAILPWGGGQKTHSWA